MHWGVHKPQLPWGLGFNTCILLNPKPSLRLLLKPYTLSLCTTLHGPPFAALKKETAASSSLSCCLQLACCCCVAVSAYLLRLPSPKETLELVACYNSNGAVSFLCCLLSMLSPLYAVSFLYCLLFILSPLFAVSFLYCLLSILSPSYTVSFLCCLLSIEPVRELRAKYFNKKTRRSI